MIPIADKDDRIQKRSAQDSVDILNPDKRRDSPNRIIESLLCQYSHLSVKEPQ